VKKRILVCEPDRDVRALLELSVTFLGYETARALDVHVDAVLLEPGCPAARAQLLRFGGSMPPVVCLSVHPREDGLEPPETVAYLMKPVGRAQLGAALAGALAP
jgi:CheY-like chemotaxis protein